MSPAPILISGSGLCGLLVGRALATHGIPFIIYERDQSFTQRAQGYRLRMSVDGLGAIKRILPPDAWQVFREGVATTRGGGFQQINAITGESINTDSKPYEDDKKDEDDADEIPIYSEGAVEQQSDEEKKQKEAAASGRTYGVARGYLRSQLAKSIEDRIQYGKNTTSYTVTKSGVIAHFEDGTDSPEGSLLIGTDGISSYIAKQLSHGKLKVYDTGARMIHGQTTSAAFKGLGEGVWGVFDDTIPDNGHIGMICNVRPGDMHNPDITFGWSMVGSPGVIEAPGDKFSVVGKVAADLSVDLTKKWADRVRPIFEQQVIDEAGFWKVTTSSPDGVPDWPNEPRVTIVGDAAHSMTPAGGNGANTALQTASILGEILRKHNGWSEDVTAEYEKEMRVVGSTNVKKSFESAKKMMRIKELKEDLRGGRDAGVNHE